MKQRFDKKTYEEHIVTEDGEVIQSKTIYQTKDEPEYVKLYIDCVFSLKGVRKRLNPIFIAFLEYMSYADSDAEYGGQLIFINKPMKLIIAKKLNLGIDSINKAVSEFTKHGLFKRITNGMYQVNPDIVGRGEWKDIKNIKATFDFGKKEVKADIIRENDEKEDNKVEIIGTCPKCGNNIIKDIHGIRCKENCGFKILPNDLSVQQIQSLLNKHTVEQVGKDYKMIIFPEIISENGMYYWKKKIQLLQVKEDKITTEQTKKPIEQKTENTTQIQSQNKEENKKILGKCPNCGNNILWGKYGAYCAGGCGVNVSRIYGVYLTKEQVQALLNGKSISYTANGWKNTVFPEIENHIHNDKTTPEWKRKSEKI